MSPSILPRRKFLVCALSGGIASIAPGKAHAAPIGAPLSPHGPPEIAKLVAEFKRLSAIRDALEDEAELAMDAYMETRAKVPPELYCDHPTSERVGHPHYPLPERLLDGRFQTFFTSDYLKDQLKQKTWRVSAYQAITAGVLVSVPESDKNDLIRLAEAFEREEEHNFVASGAHAAVETAANSDDPVQDISERITAAIPRSVSDLQALIEFVLREKLDRDRDAEAIAILQNIARLEFLSDGNSASVHDASLARSAARDEAADRRSDSYATRCLATARRR